MAIPESQLETWSNQGAVKISADAYASVKAALEAPKSPIREFDYDPFLQGSYRNRTNIYGDSDVDIDVQLNATFGRDISALPQDQQTEYRKHHSPASYQWKDFHRDVIKALELHFGAKAVTCGNKAIKVKLGTGRMTADVVPALHYRKYHYFYSPDIQSYTDGIKFHDSRGNEVINYPKPHIENGQKKNAEGRTNGWYKPTVRIFKNARSYLIDQDLLSADVAPSYFVECLLYNVPDDKFGNSYEDSFVEIFNWLWSQAQVNDLVCQNGLVALFGNTPEQWDLLKARQFFQALKKLWDNW